METSRKSQYIRNRVCTETDCNNSTIYLSCTRSDLNEVGHILISSSTLKSNVNTSFSFNIYITKLKTHLPLHMTNRWVGPTKWYRNQQPYFRFALIYLELAFELRCWDLKSFSFLLTDNFLSLVNSRLSGIRIFTYLSTVLAHLSLLEYSHKWNSGFRDVFPLRSHAKRGNSRKYSAFGREIIFIESHILEDDIKNNKEYNHKIFRYFWKQTENLAVTELTN